MLPNNVTAIAARFAYTGFAGLAALLVAVSTTGCSDRSQVGDSSGGRSAGAREKIVITGSSTVAPLMERIGRRFESQNQGIRVDVQTGGSSRGISDALNGVATLGMSSRMLKSNEQTGLVTHSIGMDGICMVVHRDNPIANLTTEQIQSVYRGVVDDWRTLGGNPGPIVVINKAEGRGTLEVFLSRMDLKVTDINADLIAGDNQQVIKSINSNPQAIGYVSVGAADHEVQHDGKLKILQLDGVAPTVENIRSGNFKMTRPLLLISKGDAAGSTAKLIEFARSLEVADLLKEQNFVSTAD